MSVEIKASEDVIITSTDGVLIEIKASEDIQTKSGVSVEAKLNKWTIVSDDIYIASRVETLPLWFKEALDGYLSNDTSVAITLNDLKNTFENFQTGYTQQIGEINNGLDNLSYNISTNYVDNAIFGAGIQNLEQSKVSATEAQAISNTTIGAWEISPTGGGAWFNSKISSFSNTQQSQASSISSLSAQYNGLNVTIQEFDEVLANAAGWSASSSKLITAPDGSITGWSFADGSNIQSNFKIQAQNFSISDGITGYTPFSIEGSNINFNGKVSFNNVTGANVAFNEAFDDGYSEWISVSKTGEKILSTDSMTGQYALQIGNNSADDSLWVVHSRRIPFDPNKLYRIKCRAKRTLGTGATYIGICGFLADGITKSNTAGTDSYSSQYYVALSAGAMTASYVEYVGYVKGTATVGNGGLAPNALNPATVYSTVKYISPMIIANYSIASGIQLFDTFSVEEVEDFAIDPATLINANTTTINGGKITTGSITTGQLAVGIGIVNGYVQSSDFVLGGAGFRLKSNAAGTYADPTIYGAYIRGGTLDSTTMNVKNLQTTTDAGHYTKAIFSAKHLGTSGVLSTNTGVYDIYSYNSTDITSNKLSSATQSVIFLGETKTLTYNIPAEYVSIPGVFVYSSTSDTFELFFNGVSMPRTIISTATYLTTFSIMGIVFYKTTIPTNYGNLIAISMQANSNLTLNGNGNLKFYATKWNGTAFETVTDYTFSILVNNL